MCTHMFTNLVALYMRRAGLSSVYLLRIVERATSLDVRPAILNMAMIGYACK